MAERYLTIFEAAELKGVAPATIHEAICSGTLPTIVDYRGSRDDCRLVGRWELEQWAPGTGSDGGGRCPLHHRPRFTVLSARDRTTSHTDPVLS